MSTNNCECKGLIGRNLKNGWTVRHGVTCQYIQIVPADDLKAVQECWQTLVDQRTMQWEISKEPMASLEDRQEAHEMYKKLCRGMDLIHPLLDKLQKG